MSIPEIKSIKYYENGDAYIKYKNGDIYKGGVKGKQPHGQGTFAYANENVYTGQVENGKPNGYGNLLVKDQYTYEGELKEGKPHGQGNFEYFNEDIYIGEVKDDKPHGYGKFEYKNGNIYAGYLESGKRNGWGELKVKDKYTYSGEFKDNKPNGYGELLVKDKFTYIGELKNGQPHGRGKFEYENGNTYEGSLKDGKRDGWGELKIKDKSTYSGEFMDNKPNGYGKLVLKGEYVYEGEFKDGKPHGQGKFKYENGNTYEGSVKDGKRDGWGELKVKKGIIYTGEFRNNISNGYGVISSLKSKYRYEGQMRDHTQHGIGEVTIENGDSYHGLFQNGKVYNLSPFKKNQKVLVIIKDITLLNKQPIEARYSEVKLLNKDSEINESLINESITRSTKGNEKKKKIKIIITDHALENGELTNQDLILNDLNKILDETKKYNDISEEPVQNIDITFHSCYGSSIVYKNKAFQDVMKSYINAKINVRISAGDENYAVLANFSNGKNVLPDPEITGSYRVNRFDLNEETDFNNIKPSKVKDYSSIYNFMDDNYELEPSDHENKKETNNETESKSLPKHNVTENKENASENGLSALVTASPPKGFNPESKSKRPTDTKKQKTNKGKSMRTKIG